jgi:hypothetical protein
LSYSSQNLQNHSNHPKSQIGQSYLKGNVLNVQKPSHKCPSAVDNKDKYFGHRSHKKYSRLILLSIGVQMPTVRTRVIADLLWIKAIREEQRRESLGAYIDNNYFVPSAAFPDNPMDLHRCV